MERRALIAIGLSALVIVLWTQMLKRQQPPLPPPGTSAPVSQAAPERETDSYQLPDELRQKDQEQLEEPRREDARLEEPPADEAATDEQAIILDDAIVIDNGLFEVVLTNRGGRARSWKLLNISDGNGGTLELIPPFTGEPPLQLAFNMDDRGLADVLNSRVFEVQRLRVADGGERVEFKWSDGRGLVATKSFTFYENEWLVDVDVQVVDRGRRLPARLTVGPSFAAQDSSVGRSTYAYKSQGVWNLSGDVSRKKKKKLVAEDGSVSGSLRWAGLEDQYFAALIIPGAGRSDAQWSSVELIPALSPDSDDEAEAAGQPIMAVSVPEGGARLYYGPKNFTLLEGLGSELEDVVWFATNPFLAWVSRQIFFALIWIHDNVVSNYGFAIVVATFILRVLLFPVNQYSMVSMKKAQIQMQRLQPKMKAIKAKYAKKKDAQSRSAMNQETMALYKTEGVNPMGGVTGCLPLLAQFPILIGFYNMLTVAVELRGAPFMLWIQDLSQKDPYYITPILMAGTMFLQQKLAMNKVKDPMQAQQQKIMMLMPFFFGYICIQMPAGLVLYWFVNNILGIGQQWLVNRQTGRLETAAQKA